MTSMQPLAVGEKYLSIRLAGHNPVAAFKNKDKKKPTDPDYIGNDYLAITGAVLIYLGYTLAVLLYPQ